MEQIQARFVIVCEIFPGAKETDSPFLSKSLNTSAAVLFKVSMMKALYPSSDECVQITAAYCASTNDASCSLLELAFVRQVGRGRLSLLVADDVIVQADVNVSVVPTACPCRGPLEGLDAGSGCPANVTAANVFAAASDPHSGVVTVDADFISQCFFAT